MMRYEMRLLNFHHIYPIFAEEFISLRDLRAVIVSGRFSTWEENR